MCEARCRRAGSRSSSTTESPRRAKWSASQQPKTPPPTTTLSARRALDVAAVDGGSWGVETMSGGSFPDRPVALELDRSAARAGCDALAGFHCTGSPGGPIVVADQDQPRGSYLIRAESRGCLTIIDGGVSRILQNLNPMGIATALRLES